MHLHGLFSLSDFGYEVFFEMLMGRFLMMELRTMMVGLSAIA
jgi:hypothetical protein